LLELAADIFDRETDGIRYLHDENNRDSYVSAVVEAGRCFSIICDALSFEAVPNL
jgi:hypothetical protein